MKHDSTTSSAKKEDRLTISSIRVRQADPPAWPWTPEIIEPDRQLQSLLNLCGRCDSIRRLLDYFVPVHSVRACESCGQAVALISVAGEIRLVSAERDSDSCPPFQSHGWTVNALGSHHVCEDQQ
jgi:hypothetical protein